MSLGPCQPKAHDLLNNTFPKTYEKSGHIRSFNECYYYKKTMMGNVYRGLGYHIHHLWKEYFVQLVSFLVYLIQKKCF